MKLRVIVLFACLFNVGYSAVIDLCPKLCKCDFTENSLKAKCTSQKFFHKLTEKQANVIESLDLSNCSIKRIDKRLEKLQNLHHLDLSNNGLINIEYFPSLHKLETLSLSNNKLKTIPFSILPIGIKTLDISSNYIVDLPKDWHLLHNLRTINLHGNPVNCDESAINKYVNLHQKVNITENVLCNVPKKLKGTTLQSLIVEALLNPMLGDQEETTENEEEVDNVEFLKYSTTPPYHSEQSVQADLFEGSGEEEGSGDSDKIEPSACIIDCSTFKPLTRENNTSPFLSVKEQVGILIEDLFGKEEEPTSTPSIPSITEQTSTSVEVAVEKKENIPISELPKTTKKTEKLIVDTEDNKETENLERASMEESSDTYTYYLIGVVITLMVLVAIFIIIKKKTSQGRPKRKRNSINENGICEEMKPLGKYKEISNGTNGEKPRDDEIRPERIPLMNGQNGKSDITASQKGSLEDLNVNESPSPKLERVTITASEIPPSVLKTPQLVHRELNSEGEIVTKPLDDSY